MRLRLSALGVSTLLSGIQFRDLFLDAQMRVQSRLHCRSIAGKGECICNRCDLGRSRISVQRLADPTGRLHQVLTEGPAILRAMSVVDLTMLQKHSHSTQKSYQLPLFLAEWDLDR